MCGEAAADPSLIPLLIGLGVEELSVAPASIQAVRGRAGALDVARCRALAARALGAATAGEVRAIAAEGAALADRPAEFPAAG